MAIPRSASATSTTLLSDYYRIHRMVADYVDASLLLTHGMLAKAIDLSWRVITTDGSRNDSSQAVVRPGSSRSTLDPVITGPLTNLRLFAKELGEINDYASQFHHDTSPVSDTAPVIDAELLAFARRALTLIYKNGIAYGSKRHQQRRPPRSTGPSPSILRSARMGERLRPELSFLR